MQAIDKITGVAIPLGLSNVDTDLIMPAPYLKTISRAGLGQFAFESLRAKPGNIFDQPRHQGAPILIAGDNFGCGSSREHAPWGLVDMGLRVIIAPSFADIFGGNAFKNGLLLVALDKAAVERLMTVAPAADISIDLQAQRVTTPMGDEFRFEIDPFRKHCLLQGLDEIGLTEKMADDIRAYEAMALRTRPWLGVRAVEKTT